MYKYSPLKRITASAHCCRSWLPRSYHNGSGFYIVRQLRHGKFGGGAFGLAVDAAIVRKAACSVLIGHNPKCWEPG